MVFSRRGESTLVPVDLRLACRPRAVRRRVGGRGHEWFDEELSERRVSYERMVVPVPSLRSRTTASSRLTRPSRGPIASNIFKAKDAPSVRRAQRLEHRDEIGQ